jgi:hypothetical protein
MSTASWAISSPARAEPFADLLVRRVEVIAAGVLADVLAGHGRHSPSERIGKRPFEVRQLVGEHLERYVEESGWPQRTREIADDLQPIFGRDVLHCIDAQHAVERIDVNELLEPGPLDLLGEPAFARLLDHPGRLVGPDDASALGDDELEIAARPARNVEDPVRRACLDHARHERPVRLADRVQTGVVVRRVARVVTLDRGTTLREPRASVHVRTGYAAR